GRLVVNVVTLESEVLLLEIYAKYGGSLIKLNIARAEPIGGLTGWKPMMPVTQFAVVKR
ncbi:MAG: precorrin-6Y C5,15-methyltransferase (decarboxylating), partial [Paracoccaceae bacterium]